MPEGFVYVLVSANSEFVKIGRTEKTPFHRLREINFDDNYAGSGPWALSDFRQVHDCVVVETLLHRRFGDKRVQIDTSADELFAIAPVEASRALEALEPDHLVKSASIDQMTGDRDFSLYIKKLFSFSGLPAWLNIQGAWVFALYPSTGGGRYFTLNVGPHEVAFTTIPYGAPRAPMHMIVVDRLIYDFPQVRQWVEQRDGTVSPAPYASALPRATSISF